jgi:hypothetical protein
LALSPKLFPIPTSNGFSVCIFNDIMNDEVFQKAAYWHVIITDIIGSTHAIYAGSYTEVNMIGAASILTVLQELGQEDIPYVFGGDSIGHMFEVLMQLQRLARDNFELGLQVGHTPVKMLVNDGFKIEAGKYELCTG